MGNTCMPVADSFRPPGGSPPYTTPISPSGAAEPSPPPLAQPTLVALAVLGLALVAWTRKAQ